MLHRHTTWNINRTISQFLTIRLNFFFRILSVNFREKCDGIKNKFTRNQLKSCKTLQLKQIRMNTFSVLPYDAHLLVNIYYIRTDMTVFGIWCPQMITDHFFKLGIVSMQKNHVFPILHLPFCVHM